MRAKAGDPPRTMAQKILAGRSTDPTLGGEFVDVKVDQVVLARAPEITLTVANEAGLKKAAPELAVAYDGTCVTSSSAPKGLTMADFGGRGVVLGRPGIGFSSPVHLERFASPSRLCLTDDPRMSSVGGVGMMTWVVSPQVLSQALISGSVALRPPRSIQILLTNRVRPFVCARDIALELVRRGLPERVRRIDAEHRAPVVLEFAGPGVRLLSVPERAVLSSIAPSVGAVSALFLSDERTEGYLRDQRRSKAHRGLSPDAGAPCDDVITLDLGAIDPLLLDDHGVVRPVRDLQGKDVLQVVLGGDSGATLRDFLSVAALLKSKRVPSHLDFIVAVPTRQMLELLSTFGALGDLIASGARLVEPDSRVLTGELYPPSGLSLRNSEPSGRVQGGESFVTASPETLAYAVASGVVGDPRGFKRPVRITMPREYPTDDVLVSRGKVSASSPPKADGKRAPAPSLGARKLQLQPASRQVLADPVSFRAHAVVCASLDEVRAVVDLGAATRALPGAVIASYIPSGLIAWLSDFGVLAFEVDAATLKQLRPGQPIDLPAPSGDGRVQASSGSQKVSLVFRGFIPAKAGEGGPAKKRRG